MMTAEQEATETKFSSSGNNILVEIKDQIAWLFLNRPEKRNAMNPAMHEELLETLEKLELDDRCGLLVLSGAGDSFCAGWDVKEFFGALENATPIEAMRLRRVRQTWIDRLRFYPKPTIAMVNGWCFGGGFMPLICCDLALAAEEATFGISEINWGVIPGGNVTRAVADKMTQSDALYYLMTGDTFDGRKAAEIRLVNEAVPGAELREHTERLARKLLEKNPYVLGAIKRAYRQAKDMPWDVSDDYLSSKYEQTLVQDPEKGQSKGRHQFIEEKSFKPGLGAYRRDK
jgi:trans-feruloyl-CoA hydratase/vanillin synthase